MAQQGGSLHAGLGCHLIGGSNTCVAHWDYDYRTDREVLVCGVLGMRFYITTAKGK